MIEPLIERYEEIRNRYSSLGSSFADLDILQDVRTDLTILFGDFGAYVGAYKFQRNSMEHMRSVTLSCQIGIEMENNPKLSQSKAESQARCSDVYEDFIDKMSHAYSDWETIRHYSEAVKLLLFSVGSHMENVRRDK